ncbi:MAG: nucleoside transporter C-terminal domain-containing protein [Bacteroidota bacterium]|nr:nucleoside transporter C-terminal domain-containing protein [Bacteroidota bacterium]
MKKTILFANISFLIFLLFFTIHTNKVYGKESSNIEGEWHIYSSEIGTIDKNENEINVHYFTFNKDNTYLYKNKSTKKSYKGEWSFSDKNIFSLKRQGQKNLKEFEVIKLTDSEFVIKDGEKVFLFVTNEKTTGGIGNFRGIIGIFVLIFIAFLISDNKKKINWRIPAVGILMQLTFAIGVLKIAFIRNAFDGVSSFFVQLLAFTREGSLFLFGSLIENTESFGYIFAFQVLPTVIFFSALTSVLYYYGILQKVVWVFAWVMRKAMHLSGAESLSAAANIFIGQTEAPLVIKPYLPTMTKSEIMALMTGGMATIAGGVLAAYIGFLGGADPEQQKLFATHLLTASIMNAPAALFIAKIILPETKEIRKDLSVSKEVVGTNVLDSLAKGTTDGLRLAVNVGAMLLVFTAMMALMNYIVFHWIGNPTGLNDYINEVSGGQYEGFNMQFILGMIFAPIAWLIGIPSNDIVMVGQLLGEKTILNEFYAYTSLGGLRDSFLLTNPRSVIITTYALCGFANFASIGIQIGGISALAPNQRTVLSKLGLKALIGGTIASLLTASIAGMIIGF